MFQIITKTEKGCRCLYISTVKILAQRATHTHAVFRVLLVIKTVIMKYDKKDINEYNTK